MHGPFSVDLATLIKCIVSPLSRRVIYATETQVNVNTFFEITNTTQCRNQFFQECMDIYQ